MRKKVKREFSCVECDKYGACTQLCQDAEDYVNGMTERLPAEFVFQALSDPTRWPETPYSKKGLIIRLALDGGMTRKEIACHAECSERYVRKVLRWFRKQVDLVESRNPII